MTNQQAACRLHNYRGFLRCNGAAPGNVRHRSDARAGSATKEHAVSTPRRPFILLFLLMSNSRNTASQSGRRTATAWHTRPDFTNDLGEAIASQVDIALSERGSMGTEVASQEMSYDG